MSDSYRLRRFRDLAAGNAYPGRGIIAGESCDGTKAVIAYFIMGRSENSRNRVLVERDGELFTEPFDETKVEDPSLIIYTAVRSLERKKSRGPAETTENLASTAAGSSEGTDEAPTLAWAPAGSVIVSNGDQTDTIYEALSEGRTFREALDTRTFEPDAPNYTPRISALLSFDGAGSFVYSMSILKSADSEGNACERYYYDYTPRAGEGHFIHTYARDGDPLPSFCGDPRRLEVPDDIDAFAQEIWEALDAENRIALYVRYIELESGAEESRLINSRCWAP